jgi:hypothetical protein
MSSNHLDVLVTIPPLWWEAVYFGVGTEMLRAQLYVVVFAEPLFSGNVRNNTPNARLMILLRTHGGMVSHAVHLAGQACRVFVAYDA